MTTPPPAPDPEPLLQVTGLTKEYQLGWGAAPFRAVDDVSFTLGRGETLGIVGESGAGKSTVAMIVAGLTPPTSGSVRFRGQELVGLRRRDLRAVRRHIQVVFQDPFSSLDPRMRVGAVVAEPLVVHRVGTAAERRARVRELLERVGLEPRYADRFPHELSGGQAQRVSIARGLALGPEMLVLDEPVSALDLSIQAQVLNLLRDLQRELGISYIFIGHGLGVVAYVSDRVAVMRDGQVVESGPVGDVFDRPREDYTRTLLDAVLEPDRDLGRFNASQPRGDAGLPDFLATPR